jgi:hypothetical protein
MRLPVAHPIFRLYERELLELLDDTVEALTLSRIRLREANDALIRANQDNARQRQQLAEFRRTMALLK